MNSKQRFLKRTLLVGTLTVATVAVLSLLAGCKKEQPPASRSSSQAAADQPAVTTVAVEQKTCPVMEGNPIDKNIFVEYKGKKGYFCCKGCDKTFMENPEKYLDKLPQFQEPARTPDGGAEAADHKH